MFFWKRKKKEPDFESKMGELNTTVLSKKDYKNTGKIEQYVVERLEQMIELTKELDDEKEEYRIVTSYLNDIETLEKIPKEERDKISEIAVNVVQLNKAAHGISQLLQEVVGRAVYTVRAAGTRTAGGNQTF